MRRNKKRGEGRKVSVKGKREEAKRRGDEKRGGRKEEDYEEKGEKETERQ